MRLRATAALSLVLAAIGVVLIVEAAIAGGFAGYLVGLLFVAAGVGRVYLMTRRAG